MLRTPLVLLLDHSAQLEAGGGALLRAADRDERYGPAMPETPRQVVRAA